MTNLNLETFRSLAAQGVPIPLTRTLMSDQLSPVLAYRRLVAPDERTAPSFLFESVENGDRVGRHSFLGAQPSLEVWAYEHQVTILNHHTGQQTTTHEENPLEVMRRLTPVKWANRGSTPSSSTAQRLDDLMPRRIGGSIPSFGGWIGYAGYDTVRYLEPGKLPFSTAPPDDRELPDLHFGFYPQVAVFDHVAKTITAVHWVVPDNQTSIDDLWRQSNTDLNKFVARLESPGVSIPVGRIEIDLAKPPETPSISAGNQAKFEESVQICRNFISAGDIFQVVLSQRFERKTPADPFEIYRALRIVNPSPYMIYLQTRGSILVASSPEILCRVEPETADSPQSPKVTNRPLAGTRKRGSTPAEDQALEAELRADPKEKAEHIMLVDLGRNDLGRVCKQSSIQLEKIMEVERYSHVMHLSSTLTGHLHPHLDAWDALRHTLPVGTVSGAPKVRAMQIIDQLEPTRRGPYGGGIGFIGLDGSMDIALALRTMVIKTGDSQGKNSGGWVVHLQAGAGVVADSDPRKEYDETVHKAAALGRAIDLAESAFGESGQD